MICLCVAAALASAAAPSHTTFTNVAEAIQSGRLQQARAMIEKLVGQGAAPASVDPLLADLAYAEGRYRDAAGLYKLLATRVPERALFAERAGLAALQTGDLVTAASFLKKALNLEGASWRAWNAMGVLADLENHWDDARQYYKRALETGGQRGEVLNNMAWSQMIRGRWAEALPLLRRAVQAEPRSERISNNMELVRLALAEDLPKRVPSESAEDYAARLNDAGVVARLGGDRARAVAAFSRALEVRQVWYERAARNLQATLASQ